MHVLDKSKLPCCFQSEKGKEKREVSCSFLRLSLSSLVKMVGGSSCFVKLFLMASLFWYTQFNAHLYAICFVVKLVLI